MYPDMLSDVLSKLRLRGAVCFDMECSGDFAVAAPPLADAARHIVPGADHVIEYLAVLRGECWCSIPGGEWVLLQAGEVLIFPHGHAHIVASHAGMRHEAGGDSPTVQAGATLPHSVRLQDSRMRSAEPGEAPGAARVLCGFLACDGKPFNPLITALPDVLRARRNDSGNWIGGFLVLALDAARARLPGAQAMLERASEMMFLDALCRHTASQDSASCTWLAGLHDRQVGRALALIHEDPGHGWTGELLGARVGLSRSVLYERFGMLVGQTPNQYLINWRMQVAAGRLRTSTATVAAIAFEVGYESEASFSRAFRRVVGESPAAWRRTRMHA
jgi:AraC-like DNA-binding protein